jgi:excisionase family DNA binding protein
VSDYLSTREAADSLNVPYQTLMGWIYQSKIRTTRRGRYWYIHKDEVERMRGSLAA